MSSGVLLKAFAGWFFLLAVMAATELVAAGTLAYPRAWIYLALFAASTLAITLYLVRADPKLLERRVAAGPAAEKEKPQKWIQGLAQLAFLALLVVPGLDARFGWSRVPGWLTWLGDVATVGGMAIVFRVFRENSFASATIEVASEQRVIDTGPYAWVRHPMYAGALLLLTGTPLALGSYWGLLATAFMVAIIVARLLDEERYLRERLPGYRAYCERVRARLVPGVF